MKKNKLLKKLFLYLISYPLILNLAFAEDVIFIDKNQFLSEVQNKNIILDSEEQNQQERIESTRQTAALNKYLKEYLTKYPNLKSKIFPKIHPDVKDLNNDTYQLKIPCNNSNICPPVTTMSMDSLRLAFTAQLIESKTEANLNSQYKFLITGLEKFIKDYPSIKITELNKIKVANLPSYSSFLRLNKNEKLVFLNAFKNKSDALQILDKVQKLVTPISTNFNSCKSDIGGNADQRIVADRLINTGRGTEYDALVTNDCALASTDSSINLLQFTNKEFLTCVKNQASRGTCWAFAATSAIESALALIHKQSSGRTKFYNFSEQSIVYNYKKILTSPNSPINESGYTSYLRVFRDSETKIPLESSWPYNQSRERITNKEEKTYSNSCLDYINFGYYCSDSNHQGQKVCTIDGAKTYCGFKAPLSAQYPTDNIKIKSTSEIWDLQDTEASTSLTLFALLFKSQSIMLFKIPPEIQKVRLGWFPPKSLYNLKDEAGGGHAVHLVGFLSQEHLQNHSSRDIQNRASSDSGGGYFIIKNSWGTCAGDGGYYYMPMNMVMEHTFSMSTITGIE